MSFLSHLKSKEDFHQTNFGTNTITASLWAIHHQTHKRAHVSWSDLENMMNFDHFHIPNSHQEFTFLCSANCCVCCALANKLCQPSLARQVNMVFLHIAAPLLAYSSPLGFFNHHLAKGERILEGILKKFRSENPASNLSKKRSYSQNVFISKPSIISLWKLKIRLTYFS